MTLWSSTSTPTTAVRVPGADSEQIVLASGRSLDPNRTRWDGILDAEELAYCRAHHIPLGYDTAQIGWVLLQSDALDTTRPSAPERRLEFRPWSDQDAPTHRTLLGDPAVWEHLPEQYPEPFTDDTSRDLIALANADIGHEVVAVEIDGDVVGQCMIRFDTASTPPFTAEVAYWLGREHWGHGLMSRILPEFVDRSFERHPIEEIYAWIRPANVASIRVAERSGLRRAELPNEAELAASQSRSGFLRWSISRPL